MRSSSSGKSDDGMEIRLSVSGICCMWFPRAENRRIIMNDAQPKKRARKSVTMRAEAKPRFIPNFLRSLSMGLSRRRDSRKAKMKGQNVGIMNLIISNITNADSSQIDAFFNIE